MHGVVMFWLGRRLAGAGAAAGAAAMRRGATGATTTGARGAILGAAMVEATVAMGAFTMRRGATTRVGLAGFGRMGFGVAGFGVAGFGVATRTAGAEATRVGAGLGAGAALGVRAAAKVGFCPQICLRFWLIRGYHVAVGPFPARIKAQPALSTYCLPEKLDGGNSDGTACAWLAPAQTAVDKTKAVITRVTNICAPTQ